MTPNRFVRKIETLGRIRIPIKIQRALSISKFDEVEIYVDEASIILQKYTPTCVFCGKNTNIILYKEKYICEACREQLATVKRN
uniref:AbrB/MazE/SpoVT family DNA-binding domain-containing protein n=1 Tax=Alicyclobacillus tolerans TaxID=90970 RepID=UPI0035575EBE